MNKTLIILTGPTGIGKTELSIDAARMFHTEIISSDSRQIYKELKIGVARPSDEDLQKVKHYMIANKSIYEYYSAGKYELEVLDILKDVFAQKDIVFLVGGSGMYIDALCKGIDAFPDADAALRKDLTEKYEREGMESLRFDVQKLDPEQYKLIDLNNAKRMLRVVEVCIQTGKTYSSFLTASSKKRDFKIVKIGLERDREELYQRINRRVDMMFDEGLLDEARTFIKDKSLNSLNTVGYKELFPYFEGIYDFDEAVRLIKRNSRRYAKRQITWFKRDKDYKWFHPKDADKIFEYISKQS